MRARREPRPKKTESSALPDKPPKPAWCSLFHDTRLAVEAETGPFGFAQGRLSRHTRPCRHPALAMVSASVGARDGVAGRLEDTERTEEVETDIKLAVLRRAS